MLSVFTQNVIKVVKLVPKGKVVSYGQVSLMSGFPRGARQVGYVLRTYSDDYALPWWRVINNAGRISTDNFDHTAYIQKEFLELEGVIVSNEMKIDIGKYRFRPQNTILKKLNLDTELIDYLSKKFYFSK